MFRVSGVFLKPPTLTFSRGIAMKGDVHLSGRRVMKKIKMGRARPTIFHQFETLVELSDGSVVRRRSQAPKDEIRMISDQRNSTLWNPHRSDLVTVDPNATGKVNKFRQRYAAFGQEEPSGGSGDVGEKQGKKQDDFVDLMGENVTEVASGGKLQNKKENKKKK